MAQPLSPAATVLRHDHPAHDHSAHDHGHGHDHAHGHLRPVEAAEVHAHPAQPGFSLLRLSALQRLAGVAVILAALWGAVFWAMR